MRRVLLEARRKELVKDAAREAGDGAIAIRADVTSEVDVRAMVDRALAIDTKLCRLRVERDRIVPAITLLIGAVASCRRAALQVTLSVPS